MIGFLKVDVKNRNIGLDVLRTIAICLVVISHGRHLLPQINAVNNLAHGGYFGVELFFILSGYLIGSILIKLLIKHNNSLEFSQLKNFWIRRWFRTLPNYYLFVLLNIIVSVLILKNNNFKFNYLFFFQNFYSSISAFMSESWSLSIEEWFYISYPLWLFIVVKIFKLNIKQKIIIATLVYILIFTISRFVIGKYFDTNWLSIRGIVLLRLDSIAFGVLVAYFNLFHSALLNKYQKGLFLVGFVLLSSSLIIQHMNYISDYSLSYPLDYYTKTLLFTQTNLGFALLIPFALNIKIKNYTVKYIFSHISIISYSLYLIHYSFALLFFKYIDSQYHTYWLVNYVLYWLFSSIVATLCFNLFEKPTTNLRHYFTDKKVNYKNGTSL